MATCIQPITVSVSQKSVSVRSDIFVHSHVDHVGCPCVMLNIVWDEDVVVPYDGLGCPCVMLYTAWDEDMIKCISIGDSFIFKYNGWNSS